MYNEIPLLLALGIISEAGISGTMWPFLVAAPTNHIRNVTPWFNVHGADDHIVFPFLPVTRPFEKI